jgi:hypothetical protein
MKTVDNDVVNLYFGTAILKLDFSFELRSLFLGGVESMQIPPL